MTTREEINHAIRSIVNETIQETEIFQPPVDAIRLATRLGYEVMIDGAQSERGRLTWDSSGGSITLKAEQRTERYHYAAAHEIGEGICHRLIERIGLDPVTANDRTREQLANDFAAELLCPWQWFRLDTETCDFDLRELKSIYRTASHEVIAGRFLQFEIPTAVTIIDNGSVTRRHINSNGFEQLSELESDIAAQASGEGIYAEIMRGKFRVQAWPVHEDGWKREVVRTTWTGDMA